MDIGGSDMECLAAIQDVFAHIFKLLKLADNRFDVLEKRISYLEDCHPEAVERRKTDEWQEHCEAGKCRNLCA